MTISYDTTTEQDAAIEALRKQHNRETNDGLTDRQMLKRLFDQAMDSAIDRAVQMNASGIRESYKSATPEVRAQIDTLLGR